MNLQPASWTIIPLFILLLHFNVCFSFLLNLKVIAISLTFAFVFFYLCIKLYYYILMYDLVSM